MLNSTFFDHLQNVLYVLF